MTPANRSPDDVQRLRKQALEWFVRRRDSGWSEADEAAFQTWLAADARHGQAYADSQSRWDGLDAMPDDLMARLRANLARDQAMMARLQTPATPISPARSSPAQSAPSPSLSSPGLPSPSRRRFLRPVALAGLAAASGAGLLAWRHLDAQPTLVLAAATGRGQRKDVALPDGSHVRLDTATRVEIRYYRQRREVALLDGQAIFDVQADAARPFHVAAGPLRVTVVGTRFSVRHTPAVAGNDGVLVAVAHGKVRVERADAAGLAPARQPRQAAVLLTAGQQVAGDRDGALGPVGQLASYDFAPWQNNRVSFVDMPLDQALAELERYHPTGLVVRDPAVAALRLSGTFDPMTPAGLRHALPHVLPVRLAAGEAGIEVLPARR